MTKYSGAVDLSINFECDYETVFFMKKFLRINKIGLVGNKRLFESMNVSDRESIILKIHSIERHMINDHKGYMYLVYENLDNSLDYKGTGYDVLVVRNPMNCKPILQKLAGKCIGFEFLISRLKYCHTHEVGKWFSEVKYVHHLCKKYGHQLILSSGARNPYELSSMKIFDSFLNKLDILPNEYWSSLNEWLESKLRGVIYDTK